MSNTSAQPITLSIKLGEEIAKGWKALRAILGKLLTDPEPLTDDLWWIVQQRRLACAITLAVIALIVFGVSFFIRQSDAAHDRPSKFEQVYYLNNSFTFAKDDVTIYTNIFGANADPRLDTRAELRRVFGKTGNISIEDLNSRYIKFSPITVRPKATAMKIAKLPGERNLQAALQKMANLGLVHFTPATKGAGPVYSFDLEMEVFRSSYSLGTFTETFHLRADAIVERSVFWLVIFLAGLAIVFISDFTHTVLDYRWRQYFKAMAAALAEVLHYLTYAIKMAGKFPDVPEMLNDHLAKLLDEIIKQIIEQLEYLIAKSDDREAQALREEALKLQQEVMNHKALPVQTEAELERWKTSLENIIAHTEQLRQRTVQLSKRKFRHFRVPLTKESLKQAISQTNRTIFSGFENLKATVIKINQRREDKRQTHEKVKIDGIKKIADLLDNYLDGATIKQAMGKLGEPFPLDVEPEELFKIRPIYARGEAEYIDGKQRLVYQNFYFAVKTSENPQDDPVWFMIKKVGDDYIVEQAAPDPKHSITSGTITLPALNPQESEVNIKYTVKVTPEIAMASKDTRDFKITMSDVALIEPKPDPAQFFENVPLPDEPKMVKLEEPGGFIKPSGKD